MTETGRVLVIGDVPIGFANGIGETLANLFADEPDAAIFQCHPGHLRPLAGEGRGAAVGFTVPQLPRQLPSAAAILYQPVLKWRQAAAERELYEKAAGLLRANRIQAVMTYPITPWVLFAAVRLRRAFPDLRFVFYVMDDWEGHHTCFGLPFTARRRAALSEMVATADVRFACSHAMKQDYERRFQNAWDVLHKGVDVSATPAAEPRSQLSNILYAGAMNMFRFDAVIAFAEGLRLYREASGRDITLTLLGPAPDREYASGLAPYPFVRTEPWLDNDACQRRMADADLLYLPLSFAEKLERIANLAMPTKFSEYLASGRPSIFHVPVASEVYALATRAALPLTLTTLDPVAIRDVLASVFTAGVDMTAYRHAAQALLRDEFDQRVLRTRLHDALFPQDHTAKVAPAC
jgi:hypothetical protein